MARGKTLVVLLLLAAGLGGLFYYDTYWLNPKREKAESAKGRIWTVEPKDVEGVTIARKGETVRLKRTADGWEMLEPLRVRADRSAVDDMITGLATARMDREIDPNPAKPADFGLDPPEAEVRLEVKGAAAPLVLRVGSKNPTGVWVYAREGAKPAVMTMSESVARDTARPVADFRDRSVIAFDRRNLTGLDLEVAGDQVSLAADEPGKWRIVKPRALRADAEVVADFLEKLEGAKAIEFADDAPKTLAPYGLDKLTKVELAHGRGGVTLEKDGTGWKLTAPEALKADSSAVTGFLWKIRDLRALGFLAETAAEAPRFLGRPEVTVRLWEEGAKGPKTLLLQSSPERRGGQPAAVAAVQGEGPVMLVEGRMLVDLAPGVAELRDRALLPAFDIGDIKKARVAAGDKPLVVEKSGTTEWKVVEPARGSTKEGRVASLLLTLRGLKWKEIAAKGPDDAAKWGLDKPELEVTVFKDGGAELATLLVGRTDGAVTYVKLKAEPGIFAVSSKDLDDLRKARTEIPY